MVQKADKGKDLFLIGVGASAGGLEAQQILLSHQPEFPIPVSIAIIQHLSPTHKSLLTQLLRKETPFEVVEITDGMELNPSHVYIAPPNTNVEVKGKRFVLSETSRYQGPKPSIDLFFNSLAKEYGSNGAGVILSGTGSDGRTGVAAVKEHGGYVLVQDPSEAAYNGMPLASIETGHADRVESARNIFLSLINLLTEGRHSAEKKDSDSGIMEYLRSVKGCDFNLYKKNTIHRRIKRRMDILHFSDISDYEVFLRSDRNEADYLYNDLLIGVTGFFRDKAPFKVLLSEMISLLENHSGDDNIRIWVAGCATGEEAYSIAILLLEAMYHTGKRRNVQIFATDLDETSLQTARRGVYNEESLKEAEPRYIQNYFTRKGHELEVNKAVRDMILFSRHNLLQDPPFLRLDMIACRNLLIYFIPEIQRKLLYTFNYSLKKEGYLFLGKSESIGNLGNYFETIDSRNKIFRCKIGLKVHPVSDIPSIPSRPSVKSEKRKGGSSEFDLTEAIRQTLNKIYFSQSAVVDENLTLIRTSGEISRFFRIPEGDVTLNILKLLPEQMGLELRAMLHRARKNKIPVKGSWLPNGETKVRFQAVSIDFNGENSGLYLIGAEEEPLSGDPGQTGNGTLIMDVSDRDAEFLKLSEQLQIVIEELETSNEELQATNEELQSSNEELQSTNEELETANEELQSSNEELQIAYTEIRQLYEEKERIAGEADVLKNQYLSERNRLNTILELAQVGIVELDRNLNVIYSNTAFSQMAQLPSEHMRDQLFLSWIPESEKEDLWSAMEGSDVWMIPELRLSGFKGNVLTVSVSGKKSKNKVTSETHIILVITDVTEQHLSRKELTEYSLSLESRIREELARRLKMESVAMQQSKLAGMGEMISAIAHQWRQPLSAIAMGIQDLEMASEEGELTPDYLRDSVTKTLEQIKQLSGTIDMFQNFFRPVSESVRFNLVSAVARASELAGQTHSKKLPPLKTEHEGRGSIFVHGYEDRFIQAILNILNNAYDAMSEVPAESFRLDLRITDYPGRAVVEIRDYGTGITSENIQKIFEPYFSTKKKNGTGLGLYISRMIIEEQLGGKICFENVNPGTKFTIELPAVTE